MAWNDTIRDWSAVNEKVNRKAIEDEWIIVKYTDSEKVITNARHAYLFSDILVLTKLLTSKGEKKSEGLKDVILLRYCQVESLPDTAKVTNAISLSISMDDYVNTWILMFRIPGSKLLWLKLIGDSIIASQKSNIAVEDDLFIPELEKKSLPNKGRFKVRDVTKKLIRSTSIIRRREEVNKDKEKIDVPKTVIFAEKQSVEGGDSEDLFDFLSDLKISKKEKNKAPDLPALPLSSLENLPHSVSTPDCLVSPQSGRSSLRRTTDDGEPTQKKSNSHRFSTGSRTPKSKFDILSFSAVTSRSDSKKRKPSRSTGSHSERHSFSKPKEFITLGGYLSDN